MRSKVTGAVVAGALVPSGIALLGYVAAGSPHVDCDHPDRPAAIVVAVLGLAAIVGAVISGPVTLVVAAYAGTSLVRHRHRGLPDRKERRIYVVLLAWGLIAVLPAVILGVSINADPLCFSF